ncbi:TatD family hydrolase [Marinivivus vitaminiproducens]|uniref:TatD family hydrolase n=1 Tax=Marinivivus vitaminiproducens TaxID=3035935 RepID=UPI00279BF98A|nr:TatD family hydrolase [Geminicoccaceae bacterium SCSIO 64248]
MLVDSHCHLDLIAGEGDILPVVQRARASDVRTLVSISTRLSTFPSLLARVEPVDDVWCSVGVHPHNAGKEPTDAATLIGLTDHPKVVGVGEAGLDYFYDNAPRPAQAEGFRAHIAAARATGLPVIVHTRDADDDTIAILRDETAKGAFPGVIHCYSTGPALAEAALEMGLYLGLGGILTFNRSVELRETIARVPLERLILETDAPYLAPQPKRGKPNEPAYIPMVADVLAEVKGSDRATIDRVTTDNFFRLFAKASRPADAA